MWRPNRHASRKAAARKESAPPARNSACSLTRPATVKKSDFAVPLRRIKSVFGDWFPSSTGDLPDGTETTVRGNENGLLATWLGAVPVGRSPTGAGESPALPIFKRRSKAIPVRSVRFDNTAARGAG